MSELQKDPLESLVEEVASKPIDEAIQFVLEDAAAVSLFTGKPVQEILAEREAELKRRARLAWFQEQLKKELNRQLHELFF